MRFPRRRLPPSTARLPLLVLLALGWPVLALAVPPSPDGGCPQPPNALVLTELMTGSGDAPRWVEISNPGKYALSLSKVLLTASEPGAKVTVPFNLGLLVGELPAGEAIAVGHVPEGKTGAQAWLKLKILDLGPTFALPLCKGKLSLDGPGGSLDMVAYNLCDVPGLPAPQVWGLDPAFTDECKNDEMATWCQAPVGGDVIGSPGKQNVACDLDGDGYSSSQGDCDDQKKNVHPGAVEVCNGLDDDCEGQTDDGVGAPAGVCLSLGVCAGPLGDGTPVAKCEGKTGWVCTYPFGYESTEETLCDGFDNDCDGKTDEGLLNACGKCGPTPYEQCNSLDDDCNGKTDDGVQLPSGTCTGSGVCAQGLPICDAGQPMCALPPSHETTETWCDGQDNDCDGQTDEELGLGGPCSVGVGACAGNGIHKCGPGGQVVCNGEKRAAGTELCGDGLDNNCDGKTDEGFAVGEQCAAGTGICRVVGKRVCSGDHMTAVCNVKPAPAASERCGNLLDDDCDGETDESGCTGGAPKTGCGATRPGIVTPPWSLGLFLFAWAWVRRSRRHSPRHADGDCCDRVKAN